jgi:2-oxoglutarate ferredoxin oxidoreductase subunit alpha
MADASVNIVIGGEAGQGLATVGTLMTRALVRMGYEVLVSQDYESRIRGGHNTFNIRFSPEPVDAPREDVDILVALNQESVDLHKDDLSGRGVVVLAKGDDPRGVPAFEVPFEELAEKKIYYNTAALGVLAAVVCGDLDVLSGLMEETFGKKGREVIDDNVAVLEKAFAWKNEQEALFECPAPAEGARGRLSVTGNDAIALGAMAAGVTFCAFYPMTPSTSIPLTLAKHEKDLSIVVEQAEDEIAAMNMCLGAAYAGARALVATSGGGFALMTEGLSLAGITETPVVIALVMRPGPATGLPTRTEQGDLWLALHAGHGEFPRAILAPGDARQCFALTHWAFDLAERSQGPVFVLSDQYLADSYRAVDPFDLEALEEPAGPLDRVRGDPGGYRRYDPDTAEDGVSPRLVPGLTEALVRVDSDEHTPEGFITEDAGVRVQQQDKRMAKEKVLVDAVVPPEAEGPKNPDLLLVCWGSTLGAVREAVRKLGQDRKTGLLHFSQVWPLVPDMFVDRLQGAGRVVMVEANATGQFADLLRMAAGVDIPDRVLRYDGRPFTADHITRRLADMGIAPAAGDG